MTDTISKFTIKRRDINEAWDVRQLVTNVKWTTDMNYSAGELNFDLIEERDGFGVRNGDIVAFDWNGHNVFKGYVFKTELKQGKTFSVTAYDALRYFKSSDSMVFSTQTLAQRFTTICKYLKLKNKVIKTPKHKLKAELADNKSYFSMLESAIKQTYTATGERYYIRDNYGTVELRRYPFKELNMIIGDESLLTDYTLTRSIEQAANVVKVVKSSTKKGKTTVSTEMAKGNTVKKWGKLVHIETTAKKLNSAQMKTLAKQTLKRLNKQTTQLKLSTVGNIDLQAGNSVVISVDKLRDMGIGTKRYLIRRAVHNFGTGYSVDIDMEW